MASRPHRRRVGDRRVTAPAANALIAAAAVPQPERGERGRSDTHLPRRTCEFITADTRPQYESRKERSDMARVGRAHATTFDCSSSAAVSPALNDEAGARVARHAHNRSGSAAARG